MERRAPLIRGSCTVLPFDAMAGRCRACGRRLEGRRTSWCSKDCEAVYHDNHYWQFARRAALKRDLFRCVRCHRGATPLPGRPTAGLEVNHIVPRLGRGYGLGCHHHLDNLEVLCHHHHVEVTRHQRVARSRLRTRRTEQLREVQRASRD